MSKQPQAAAQLKGTPLWRMSKKFNFAAEKIIPDSFVFCIILTFLVFVLSLLLCGKSPLELLVGWWDGLSSQFTLAFQMGIMVVVCATCARFFEFDQVCNVPETVVKAMKERFGITLADSEIAIEPDRITDCTEWVSARILDRNALYEAKQEKRRVA